MVIGIIGLEKVLEGYDELEKVNLKPFMQKATQLVQKSAKKLAPVSIGKGIQARPETKLRSHLKSDTTGNLKRGIHRKTTGSSSNVVGKVTSTAEYSMYQEFGFTVKDKEGNKRYVKPQPYMYPALDEHRQDINDGFRDYLEKHAKRSTR